MAVAVVDRAKLQAAVETVAGRIADMVRPLTDTGRQLPGSEWTVGEAAAHLAWAQQAYAQIAVGRRIVHGDATRAGLALANADVLERYPERDGARLAELIVEGTRSYVQVAAGLPESFSNDTPMGPMDIDTCTSYMLTHLMMHGWPIARALRRPVPFDAGHVELTLPFITHAMRVVLDREAAGGFSASFAVRFRGGPRLWLTFDDGELTVSHARVAKVDCTISADPMAFFLVGVGLIGQWGQIARGRLVAWGPRPWLALRFVGMFSPP